MFHDALSIDIVRIGPKSILRVIRYNKYGGANQPPKFLGLRISIAPKTGVVQTPVHKLRRDRSIIAV